MSTKHRGFGRHLRRIGFDPTSMAPWIAVGRPKVAQGWKLHLSSVPTEAERLVDAVADVLRLSGVSFKVAADLSIVESLNDGRLGPTQIGKFITIYPDQDSILPLASSLAELTEEFVGPVIPTDMRLGSVLYARYGNFVYQKHIDRLGISHRVLSWPDGSWTDDTYNVPFKTPPQVSDPFENWIFEQPDSTALAQKNKLFGPGYLIADVLNESVHGACFLALDMRAREEVQAVVLKQARHHTMSDRFGRDAKSRLHREYSILKKLEGRFAVVPARDFFTLGDSSYLVLDYLEGVDFEAMVSGILDHNPWSEITIAKRHRILGHLINLASCISDLHSLGFIHRDLNNMNVRISPDGVISLLDFEMAHEFGESGPAIGAGTAGFSSPQQRAGEQPAIEDDVFSFGCLALLALTGIDPRRFTGNLPKRADRIAALTGPAAELSELYEPLALTLSEVADERPEIRVLVTVLRAAQEQLEGSHPGTRKCLAKIDSSDLAPVIESAISGLLFDVPHTAEGLWRTLPLGGGDQGILETDLVLQRSAHSGIAGPVYVLALAAQHGLGDSDIIGQRLSRAAEWLISDTTSDDLNLPGLHFGHAGVAVALSTLGGLSMPCRAKLREWLVNSLNWPDITHGAAGQGLAALSVAPDFADHAANYLCAMQATDGAWEVPEGVGVVSGQKLTGFAHGVAGIVYFLCHQARLRSDERARDSAARGIAWLESVKQASEVGAAPQWPYSDRVETPWRWWCHGGPGIALAYLAAYETFGEVSFLETATQALATHHPLHVRYGNLSYCHGLAGLGEIYLETLRVTGDPVWQLRVNAILTPILALARTCPHGLTWLAEDPNIATADLGLGTSGVLHFLLRCHLGPNLIGLPLCPVPKTNGLGNSGMNGS